MADSATIGESHVARPAAGRERARVEIYVDLSRFAATADAKALREHVTALEDAGAHGVSFSDHLFYTTQGRPRRAGVSHTADPLTTMAAVLSASDLLGVQTTVLNTAWWHPGLFTRQFAQLTVLAGEDRVTAGLGAGWSAEEFEAIGSVLPSFSDRMDRFTETLAVVRDLFDRRTSSQTGDHVVTRDLPLSPPCAAPPKILVGGGSDRLLNLAGRYADLIDLHGDPRHGRVVGTTMAVAAAGDAQRRALTTIDDLSARFPRVLEAARAAGRNPDGIGSTTEIWYSCPGDRRRVEAAEQALCDMWGIQRRSLDTNPYVLLGSPEQIADALAARREAYRLVRICLSHRDDVAAAPYDPLRFCREVAPLLV